VARPAGGESANALAIEGMAVEEFVDALLRYASDAIAVSDRESGRFVVVSDSYCAITGYAREELIGRTSVELGMLAEAPERSQPVGVAASGVAGMHELQLRRKDGVICLFEFSVQMLGEGLMLTISRDVSERRRIEAEVERAKQEAEHANSAKSEFLSRMSHELRTPLNAIIGYGQVLELQLRDERRREDVDHILTAGKHLLALIDDVLDISRIEAGKLRLSIEPVPIAQTVNEALALVSPTAKQRHVQLDAVISDFADDSHVNADRRLLAQVLLNLLSNAIKYNRDGGRVDVSFAVSDQGRIRTLITDTGVGIAPDKLAGVFEPFDRLGAEYTEVEGTGLGLALSKRLLEAMGGSIEVRSAPGHGSTFVIELAAAAAPAGGAPMRADAGSAGLTGRELGHGSWRILYIEDNLSNLTLVERILDLQRNVELIPAMQGRIGLQLAREHRPDLIVLDVHLPDMPGSEVLRRLKEGEKTREIPVVILSADASKGQIHRLLEVGASDYLTKPLDVRHFLEVLVANLPARQDVKTPELRAARIVIVDDVHTNVSLLSMILASWGYENVLATTDSAKALRHCLESMPDLLLLDLQMPSPNGYEVMEALGQRRSNDLPILVLTAELSDDVKARARKLGANDFVNKPFDFDDLRAQVNNLLQAGHRQTRPTHGER